MIHEDLQGYGISAREIDWWTQDACWFPHLRKSQQIADLAACLPKKFVTNTPCEPQILLSFPDTREVRLEPHIDSEPPWAGERKYFSIVCVPLSIHSRETGGPILTLGNGHHQPDLIPGDILYIHPDTPHTRGCNLSGQIRYSVYFRYLKDTE